MKKLVTILAIALTVGLAFANDLFIFSADAVKAGSGRRLLPSQGVNQKTGEVVLGLAGQTDAVRATCGWYRVLPEPAISTNETFRCTNYVFSVEGTAQPIGEIKQKPRYKTVTLYSKLKLYVAACKLGIWENLEGYLKNTTTEEGVNLWQAWIQAQDFNDDYPMFLNALENVRAQLMLDEVTFNAILKESISGTYQVQVDENGNEVSDSARSFRRFH